MMRAIGDQVAKNSEYLSILDKKAIKNGKIDDKTQVEQVSVKISKIIVPAKIEKHVSLLDIGSVNIIKDKTILDYWEDESIPSGARLYYKYYYKVGDKNGQYKNTK